MDALAIADTLVAVHPGDAELLELRAELLRRQGRTHDADWDLRRCCELGRKDCCARQKAAP